MRPAKKLRWSWLPGPLYVFDEVCYRCANDAHERCYGESAVVQAPLLGETEFEKQFTCICRDPSHKDKP